MYSNWTSGRRTSTAPGHCRNLSIFAEGCLRTRLSLMIILMRCKLKHDLLEFRLNVLLFEFLLIDRPHP